MGPHVPRRTVFPRRRAVSACLVLSFVGLGFLFLHAKSVTPRAMAIGDIGGGDVGTPVRVRGHVHRASTTDGGDASLVLMDYANFATIRVVARPRAIAEPTLVSPGAVVEAVGTVFGSGGSLQIFCDDVGDVTVVQPAPTNLLPLEFVARNAGRLEGERVVVRATVADLRAVVDPRHALLRADGVSVWAFAANGWTAGRANVTGRLMMTSQGRCELFAAAEPLTVDASVAALAACPEVLLGQPVLVRDVTVEPGELLGTAFTATDIGNGAGFRVAVFVQDWDWRRSTVPFRIGDLVTVDGVVEYQATEARWRIVCRGPPQG